MYQMNVLKKTANILSKVQKIQPTLYFEDVSKQCSGFTKVVYENIF